MQHSLPGVIAAYRAEAAFLRGARADLPMRPSFRSALQRNGGLTYSMQSVDQAHAEAAGLERIADFYEGSV